MNMKKLSAAVVVMLGLGVSAAQADDGSLNFSGTVSASTCSVDAGSTNLSVKFDSFSLAAINALTPGQTSPALAKPFTIKLVGCPASVTKTRVKFEGTESNLVREALATDKGYLAVLLSDAETGTLVDANYFSTNYKDLTAGDNNLNYKVALTKTSTNSTSAGDFKVNIPFTMMYE